MPGTLFRPRCGPEIARVWPAKARWRRCDGRIHSRAPARALREPLVKFLHQQGAGRATSMCGHPPHQVSWHEGAKAPQVLWTSGRNANPAAEQRSAYFVSFLRHRLLRMVAAAGIEVLSVPGGYVCATPTSMARPWPVSQEGMRMSASLLRSPAADCSLR